MEISIVCCKSMLKSSMWECFGCDSHRKAMILVCVCEYVRMCVCVSICVSVDMCKRGGTVRKSWMVVVKCKKGGEVRNFEGRMIVCEFGGQAWLSPKEFSLVTRTGNLKFSE